MYTCAVNFNVLYCLNIFVLHSYHAATEFSQSLSNWLGERLGFIVQDLLGVMERSKAGGDGGNFSSYRPRRAKEVASFEAKKAQYLTAAKTSPGQIWLKLVDEGKPNFPIVGGACLTHWKDEHQPRHMPDQPHEGFEPGSQLQKVSEQFYGQLHDWHSQIMRSREHICELLLTVPRRECTKPSEL